MAKYRVKALYFQGVQKKVHKSGEELKSEQVPGGDEAAKTLIESGHLELISEDSKSESGDIEPKDAAETLIEESEVLAELGDIVGALEKLEEAKEVYPKGKKAPKMIKELQEKLG